MGVAVMLKFGIGAPTWSTTTPLICAGLRASETSTESRSSAPPSAITVASSRTDPLVIPRRERRSTLDKHAVLAGGQTIEQIAAALISRGSSSIGQSDRYRSERTPGKVCDEAADRSRRERRINTTGELARFDSDWRCLGEGEAVIEPLRQMLARSLEVHGVNSGARPSI